VTVAGGAAAGCTAASAASNCGQTAVPATHAISSAERKRVAFIDGNPLLLEFNS
jgi:hypothetical protein